MVEGEPHGLWGLLVVAGILLLLPAMDWAEEVRGADQAYAELADALESMGIEVDLDGIAQHPGMAKLLSGRVGAEEARQWASVLRYALDKGLTLEEFMAFQPTQDTTIIGYSRVTESDVDAYLIGREYIRREHQEHPPEEDTGLLS